MCIRDRLKPALARGELRTIAAVSYTHLDVYKRQVKKRHRIAVFLAII
ncbi:hypothetical protein [Erwinia amylovora]